MKSDERSCPVCRTTKYQKRITRYGSRAFEVICSIKIQKYYRGYSARKKYYLKLKYYYKKGEGGTSLHKTKFYEKELSTYLSKLEEDFQDRKMESDSILRWVDC